MDSSKIQALAVKLSRASITELYPPNPKECRIHVTVNPSLGLSGEIEKKIQEMILADLPGYIDRALLELEEETRTLQLEVRDLLDQDLAGSGDKARNK